jgi:hypothetical protein
MSTSIAGSISSGNLVKDRSGLTLPMMTEYYVSINTSDGAYGI